VSTKTARERRWGVKRYWAGDSQNEKGKEEKKKKGEEVVRSGRGIKGTTTSKTCVFAASHTDGPDWDKKTGAELEGKMGGDGVGYKGTTQKKKKSDRTWGSDLSETRRAREQRHCELQKR